MSMLISIIAIFFSLLPVFMLHLSRNIPTFSTSILPPGTFGWPLIGETLEFLNPTFVQDRMRKFSSKIFRTSVLGEPVAVFNGPDGNKCLFTNEKTRVGRWYPLYLDRIFPYSSSYASDEEGKIKTLQMYRGFLQAEALQGYIGTMDSVAKHQLNNTWENKNQVQVYKLSKTYTFTLSCKLILSIDDPIEIGKLYDPFDDLLHGLFTMPINIYGTPFKKALNASKYMRKIFVERIKRRKMELADGMKSNDILSRIFCTDNDEEADSATRILGLLVAGDSARVVITFIVHYLAELPHIYENVLKEQREILKDKLPGQLLNWKDIHKMKYSWNVAREVMRITSPVRGSFREALTDITYEGFSVPKGWKLHWTNSTHMDATYFPDPEKFDPIRFEGDGPAQYTYVPFGGGSYRCPGNGYARLQILVFMHNLVTKFKWEKIFPDEKIIYTSFPMLEKGLPILLHPH